MFLSLPAIPTRPSVIATAQRPGWPTVVLGSQGPADALLNLALARLGYLPIVYQNGRVSLTPSTIRHVPTQTWHWHWRYASTPAPLRTLWVRNQFTVMTQGAVMQLQVANGLSPTGRVNATVWDALARGLAQHRINQRGYSYVWVSKNLPETLRLWFNGHLVLTSLCNTGIPQSPTPDGTWPVYLRYLSQDMSGINPFGVPYNDPGVPYVNYFYGGDAVHGFIRSAYGFPQSLGCVELPIPAAQRAWQYIHYGTLVTVLP